MSERLAAYILQSHFIFSGNKQQRNKPGFLRGTWTAGSSLFQSIPDHKHAAKRIRAVHSMGFDMILSLFTALWIVKFPYWVQSSITLIITLSFHHVISLPSPSLSVTELTLMSVWLNTEEGQLAIAQSCLIYTYLAYSSRTLLMWVEVLRRVWSLSAFCTRAANQNRAHLHMSVLPHQWQKQPVTF